MMIEVNAGTTVEVAVRFEDATGAPIVPTSYEVWARPSGYYAVESIAIEVAEVDGVLVGSFLPTEAGPWTVTAQMTAPVAVTEEDVVEVLPVAVRPGASPPVGS
jgi:hypothetical protein